MSIRVEDLDPRIFAVTDIDAIVLIYNNAMRQIEFTRARPVFSPTLNEITVAIELHHPGIAVAIGNVNIPVLAETHVRWLIEQPGRFSTPVLAPQYQENSPRRAQLQHQMTAIIRGPDVV